MTAPTTARPQSRQLSTLLVDTLENTKVTERDGHGRAMRRRDLVSQLAVLGVPAQQCPGLPTDIVWTVDGQSCMFDLKTPEDLIASVDDGRLHDQMTRAQERNCWMYGIVLEGRVSEDDVMVGYGSHAWTYERFDNLLVSLQEEGARVVHSPRPDRTAARVLSLYRYSGKASHGSWHTPRPVSNLRNLYTDKVYRKHVELLMTIPDMGEVKANDLLDRFPLTDILGVTPEGLRAAVGRWQLVRGIGPKLASVWESHLREDFSSPLLRMELGGK